MPIAFSLQPEEIGGARSQGGCGFFADRGFHRHRFPAVRDGRGPTQDRGLLQRPCEPKREVTHAAPRFQRVHGAVQRRFNMTRSVTRTPEAGKVTTSGTTTLCSNASATPTAFFFVEIPHKDSAAQTVGGYAPNIFERGVRRGALQATHERALRVELKDLSARAKRFSHINVIVAVDSERPYRFEAPPGGPLIARRKLYMPGKPTTGSNMSTTHGLLALHCPGVTAIGNQHITFPGTSRYHADSRTAPVRGPLPLHKAELLPVFRTYRLFAQQFRRFLARYFPGEYVDHTLR